MIRMLITNAGRQALLNAEQTGTNAVTIARIGVGSGRYTPSLNQTELQQETKRLNIIEGGATGDNAFHVAYRDESDDAYSIYEFGLYLDNGILFAVYSSSDLVMQKSASSTAMLVVDVALEDVSTSQITFGSVTYEVAGATSSNAGVVTLATEQDVANGEAVNLAITPAVLGARTATETRTGLIELATVAEAQAGADAVRAITPATAKAIIDYRLASSADTITGASTTKAVTPASLTARTATTGRTGLVELATEAETLAGTDELKAITPKTLKSAISNVKQDASETVKGVVQLATTTETQAGSDTKKAVTAAGVKSAITNFSGNINNAKVVATGATSARTLASRFADGITPKDFGANGNGTNDDTNAFALLEDKVKNRMVDLEGLTYKVTSIPSNNHYYNGKWLVGTVTTRAGVFFDNNNRITNADGHENISFYPSGLSQYTQARAGTCQLALARFTNDTPGAMLVLFKSRGGAVGASKSVLPGDTISQINFIADNGKVDYGESTVGARVGYITCAVADNSTITSSGSTNVGIRGAVRIQACSDGATRDGEGVEVMDNTLRPTIDDTLNLGTSNRRWKAIYATTDVISTSDENAKQDIEEIPDEVLEAWGSVNFKQFKFKDEVTKEGDEAKLYCGVIAQQVMKVFNDAGLNACDYGLICEEEQEGQVATASSSKIYIKVPDTWTGCYAYYVDTNYVISGNTWPGDALTIGASGYYEWDISSIVATAKDKGVTEVKFVAVDENNKHQSGDVVLTFADDVGSIYEVGEDGKATIIGKLEESAVKSGVTYGVRYREAMVLESAYQRKKIADLEARIVALETA